MISAAQLRAARALLDWTRSDLAKAASISPETIKNIEHGTFRPQEVTADAIVKAFSMHNVIFTEDDGVKISNNHISTFNGYEGFKSFMDDLYNTALKDYSINGTKPICVCNVNNDHFKKNLKDYAALHIERMSKIQGLKIKMLATKKEETRAVGADYMMTKYIDQSVSLPFYVYGDKFSIINFEVEVSPQIIVIHSSAVAKSYRDQFAIMWSNASNEPFKKAS
jgi:DNA-binding XRE family transcriptional regulator